MKLSGKKLEGRHEGERVIVPRRKKTLSEGEGGGEVSNLPGFLAVR